MRRAGVATLVPGYRRASLLNGARARSPKRRRGRRGRACEAFHKVPARAPWAGEVLHKAPWNLAGVRLSILAPPLPPSAPLLDIPCARRIRKPCEMGQLGR